MPASPEFVDLAFVAAARHSLLGQAARLAAHPRAAAMQALLKEHQHEPLGAVLQEELRALERAAGGQPPVSPAEPLDYFLRRRAASASGAHNEGKR